MKFLPIVTRELLVAARQPVTYRNRFWTVTAGLLVASGFVISYASQGVTPALQGRRLFTGLAILGLAYCLIIGVRLTADCLSVEKRDGTLGLLFLTDLGGFDVLMGKLAATSLNSVYGLVALVPILAIPLQMGGVSGQTFFQVVLCLLNALFLSLTAGLFVSALSVNDRKALYAALMLVSMIAGGPYLVLVYVNTADWFSNVFVQVSFLLLLLVSPISPFVVANFPASLGTGANAFLRSVDLSMNHIFALTLMISHLISWLLLARAASVAVAYARRRRTSGWVGKIRTRVQQFLYGNTDDRRRHRRELLNINAFAWLTSRERFKSKYVWGFLAAVIGIYFWNLTRQGDVVFDDKTLIPLGFFVHAFLKIWIASEACHRIAEDRRVGALELLLSTPLGPPDIVKGQLLALWRQFALPLVTLFFLEMFLIFTFATEAQDTVRFQTRAIYLSGAVMLLVDCALIAWVAMWYGVRHGNTNRAIVQTILMFLAAPWCLYAVAVQGWEVARMVFTTQGIFVLDFRWMGKEGLFFELWWPRLDLVGKVIIWVGVGVIYGWLMGLKWARGRLLSSFRECVAADHDPTKGRAA
ncbi:MAG: hypothetical protein M2R45_01874 [Verrucomicrobia subdivision 3 bacterium]|nr:hypothetical protein [Limisphaerales bacterium]MCS1415674.1 hypothetical protein [Limisphaerales bacterium]